MQRYNGIARSNIIVSNNKHDLYCFSPIKPNRSDNSVTRSFEFQLNVDPDCSIAFPPSGVSTYLDERLTDEFNAL